MTSDSYALDVAAVGRIEAVPRILDVVCRVTGMGFAAVARVTETRWVCCGVKDDIAFGLKPGSELELCTTICNEIRQTGEGVVIDHVAADDKFCGHPVPAQYGFQSYISMPIIRADGSFFGTLCAIDPRPAKLNQPQVIEMFRLFAELIASNLDAQERMTQSEGELFTERENSHLREQFIAVLGHDLRNPLASLDSGLQLLRRTPLNDKANKIVTLMGASVRRMLGLVNDVLDLAKGKMAGGLAVNRDDSRPLAPALQHVIEETKAAYPDRNIEADFSSAGAVYVDHARIAQLFSNLMGNAIAHGEQAGWIRARGEIDGKDFVLTVANSGAPIPEEIRLRLFEPFFRGGDDTAAGLGLGLYIVSEITRAHGGTIDVTSDAAETKFVVRMPAARS